MGAPGDSVPPVFDRSPVIFPAPVSVPAFSSNGSGVASVPVTTVEPAVWTGETPRNDAVPAFTVNEPWFRNASSSSTPDVPAEDAFTTNVPRFDMTAGEAQHTPPRRPPFWIVHVLPMRLVTWSPAPSEIGVAEFCTAPPPTVSEAGVEPVEVSERLWV